jgi:hypothetical protein
MPSSLAEEIRPLSPEERDGWISRVPEPHDFAAEPRDETIAEVQSAVVQSRLACEQLSLQNLLDAIDTSCASLLSTGDARFAVAIAAYAIRIREEYP